MSLRPREERQHSRKQERVHHQNRDTDSRHVSVKLAIFALNKTIEQVDRDDEERCYHDCDERASQEVDTRAGEVDFSF